MCVLLCLLYVHTVVIAAIRFSYIGGCVKSDLLFFFWLYRLICMVQRSGVSRNFFLFSSSFIYISPRGLIKKTDIDRHQCWAEQAKITRVEKTGKGVSSPSACVQDIMIMMMSRMRRSNANFLFIASRRGSPTPSNSMRSTEITKRKRRQVAG